MSYSNVYKAHRVQHTKLRVTPNDDTTVFQIFPPQTTLLSETFHISTSTFHQHTTLRHDAHLSTFSRKNSAVRSAITDDVATQRGRRGHGTVTTSPWRYHQERGHVIFYPAPVFLYFVGYGSC